MSLGITHASLVKAGIRWLSEFRDCFPILDEQTGCGETPDVLAWRDLRDEAGKFTATVTYLIDVKISRADFLADEHKPFRNGTKRGMGNVRFYLAPARLLTSAECAARGFGLLEFDGTGIVQVSEAEWTHDSRVNLWGQQRLLRIAARDGQLAARRTARECRPGRVNQPTSEFDAIVLPYASTPLYTGKDICREHPELEEMAGNKGAAIRRANELLRRMRREPLGQTA